MPEIYTAALSNLIEEIRKTGNGQKRFELEKGVRIEGLTDLIVYEFIFPDEAELFEDAKIAIEFPSRRVAASIISISSGRLRLSTAEDLGLVLDRAVIVVDATQLLEALKERIEQAGKKEINLNRAIADATVGELHHADEPPAICQAPTTANLNPEQLAALQNALTASITYIWGPPGTGKTTVLAEVVRSALEATQRVLICSNTNRAVDQLLYAICESLRTEHVAMEGGQIVRLGLVADDKLKSKYEQYVTLDGIVERRSAELKARQRRVQGEIERIDVRTTSARNVLSRFVEFDAAQRSVESQLDATNQAAKLGRDLKGEQEAAASRLPQLELELRKRKEARFAWFSRSEGAILKDIAGIQSRISSLTVAIEKARKSYADAKGKFEAARSQRDQLAEQVSRLDRSAAAKEIERADGIRRPLVDELREIEADLAEVKASVLRNAKVLGCTCTKAYLSAKEIGPAEMVIVDEASMVLLPVIWFVAGQAKERVVICGDFRQLPPILQTKRQAVFDVLGHDVFTAAKLDDVTVDDPRRKMLQRQYRMDDKICQLIAERMYGNRLMTDPACGEHFQRTSPPSAYEGTLTIVDTSDLWPFESVNAFHSRFNLMHALLLRNLVRHFQGNGYIKERESFAISTPYSAQAKLVRKLLDSDGATDLVQVGTVHSFQGDQRKTLVLELPEGYGGTRMIGQFLQGVPPKDTGARLINVAVSRAQHQLIVLANLTYLDSRLPSHALLRSILHQMQLDGRIVPSSELLALRPIDSDLQGLVGRVQLDFDVEKLGLFNASAFDSGLGADITEARESVVIFSGFVTPRRVGELGDLLRLKVAQGVKVRCVTRPPHLNGRMDSQLGREALDLLEAIGCAVDCRARIHEKVVLIDKQIVWHGSLNALSHAHRTDESMTRLVNKGFAEAVAANMSKLTISSEKAIQASAYAENPRCGNCGKRTFYDEGHFGPYFRCEEKCGWSESLRSLQRSGRRQIAQNGGGNLPTNGPSCPVCGSKTRLRNGRFGPFYGCTRAPSCRGTCSVPVKRKQQPRKRR